MENINITGMNKAEILAALYNGSKQQGMGFLNERGRTELSVEQASELLKEMTYFDYLYGRVLKVRLDSDELNPRMYDRDNGEGACLKIIDSLR